MRRHPAPPPARPPLARTPLLRPWLPAAGAALCLLLPLGSAWAQDFKKADEIKRELEQSVGTTRGINAVPAAVPQAGRPSATHAVRSSAPASDQAVEFVTGSARLTPTAVRALDEVGKALSSAELAADRFRIEGHTDTVGRADLNLALSDARAKAVVAYLEAHFGISADRLEPVGVGEQDLLVPTPPQTPEPRNRRVRIVNMGT